MPTKYDLMQLAFIIAIFIGGILVGHGHWLVGCSLMVVGVYYNGRYTKDIRDK